jgi:hypothetical protein
VRTPPKTPRWNLFVFLDPEEVPGNLSCIFSIKYEGSEHVCLGSSGFLYDRNDDFVKGWLMLDCSSCFWRSQFNAPGKSPPHQMGVGLAFVLIFIIVQTLFPFERQRLAAVQRNLPLQK